MNNANSHNSLPYNPLYARMFPNKSMDQSYVPRFCSGGVRAQHAVSGVAWQKWALVPVEQRVVGV